MGTNVALVAEVVPGTPARFSDPARFSFAHGGKDGRPFPVPVFGLARAAKAIPDQLSLFSRLFVFSCPYRQTAAAPSFALFEGGHDELSLASSISRQLLLIIHH
jgi:hypothetical protein